MRTSEEIQSELTALEKRIQEEFIQRVLKKSSLLAMATPKQLQLHNKLWSERYHALQKERYEQARKVIKGGEHGRENEQI